MVNPAARFEIFKLKFLSAIVDRFQVMDNFCPQPFVPLGGKQRRESYLLPWPLAPCASSANPGKNDQVRAGSKRPPRKDERRAIRRSRECSSGQGESARNIVPAFVVSGPLDEPD